MSFLDNGQEYCRMLEQSNTVLPCPIGDLAFDGEEEEEFDNINRDYRYA